LTERLKESDWEGLRKLQAQLPHGWEMGPLDCPIGLDRHPLICSAGYCLACQWMRAHWDDAASQLIGLRLPHCARGTMDEEICNLPFGRVPRCPCDTGGKSPTAQQQAGCRWNDGPCSPGYYERHPAACQAQPES